MSQSKLVIFWTGNVFTINLFGKSKRQFLVGGQNLERRNVEWPIFRNFKIENIKITKDTLFYGFFSNFFFSLLKNWPGVKISNDQMENDQYFEIQKWPMLKVTGGPVSRYFYSWNYFFIFLKLFEHSNFGFLHFLKIF